MSAHGFRQLAGAGGEHDRVRVPDDRRANEKRDEGGGGFVREDDRRCGVKVGFIAWHARHRRSTMRPLPQVAWSRTATIVGAGKPLTVEVRFYANKLFEHERPHLKQIARTVAALRQ